MLRLLLPSLAAILVTCVALSLGNWQTRRAEEKILLKSQMEQALKQPPLDLASVGADIHEKRRVALTGTWQQEKTIFIDNRTHQGQAGFHVVTPLKIRNSSEDLSVLVLRGWIARDVKDRTKLPALREGPAVITVVGLSQADFIKSYELAASEPPKPQERLWQSATLAGARQWLGIPIADFVLRQTEPLRSIDASPSVAIEDGLIRDWAASNVDVDKHRGYALQWYSLAALSAALWLWFVVLKRIFSKNGSK
jgi:surfeit locus 1 family protein